MTWTRARVDAAAAYASAQKVVQTHRRLSAFLRIGQRLPEIDAFVATTLADLGCKSCFLGYRVGRLPPFPSHACLSVNECVVHGTAGYYREPLREGDLLKIDVGVRYQGWIGDAAWTYSFGEPEGDAARLMNAGKEALRRGLATIRPGVPYVEWARAVQGHVEDECGLRCISRWGGHGYGRSLHGPPHISNTVPLTALEWPDATDVWRPGMLVAVEPMVAVSTRETYMNRNEWPVYTDDGSLSVHYEHDVLVTDDGAKTLTEGLEEIEDVIDR